MEFNLQKLWEEHSGTVIGGALNVLYAIVVLVIGLAVIKKLVNLFGKTLTKRGIDPTLLPTLQGVVRALLIITLVIAVSSMVGIQPTGLVAVLGAAGLAVGLALQGSLANFAGGILLLVQKPFKNGDFIDANGESGTVIAINILQTVLKTPSNQVIYMGNGSVAGSNITNYSQEATRRLNLVFGIDYSDDSNKAKKIILDIANADERVHKDPEPFARVSNLGDSSVDITVRLWTNNPDYWNLNFDMIESVKKAFDEADISFPFPQRDIHVFNEK
tara:strand:- start:1030 stop:1851 length:822 start_codon:yes stop_codon:yes gene_type:complete